MKLTKKIETEVLKVYDSWLQAYLNGDVATYDAHLDDTYHFIGSTNNEEFLDRKATTNFFEATADQLAGKCLLKNENKILEKFGELIFITQVFDAWFLNGSEWTYYSRFRFSSVLQEKNGGWRFIYQHFSTTDNKADAGETIGFDKVNAENQELREAIKRRTFELEAKNRELEIEGALERIRAQAVAMQQSSDLLDIVVTMRNEFTKLGHEAHYFWHMMWLPETYEKAMTSGDGSKIGFIMTLPKHMHGDIPSLANWEVSDDATVIYPMNVKAAISYVDKMVKLGDFKNIDPQAPTHDDIRHMGGLTFIMARTTHGEIGYSLPGVVKNPPAEDLHILVQFAGAFDLAHRRFLDLQKAEKQAREVQIELALEKVRSRTMAMQHSDELQEASFLLDQQVRALGIKTRGCAFNIYGQNDATEWFSSEEGTMPVYRTPRENVFLEYYEAGKRGESLYIKEFEGDACAAHYDYLCTLPVMGEALRELKANGGSFPEKQIDHATFFKYGYLLFITLDFVPEAHDIFKRFAKVFEQTYTRFLDLQKAEAQAREAQIQLSLERVRAKSMAMQSSSELETIIQVVHDQFVELGITLDHAGFIIDYKSNDDMIIWLADEHKVTPQIRLPYFDSPHWNSFITAKEKGHKLFVNHLDFKTKNKFYNQIFKYVPELPEDARSFYLKIPSLTIATSLIDNIGLYIENFSGVQYQEEDQKVLLRFGEEFQQAYTRFLDLQKAEAQAKEAQIEGALEKVRSRSLAMQKSDELLDVIGIVSEQVHALRLKFDTICFGESNKDGAVKFWLTSKGLPKPILVDVPPIKNKGVQRVVKAQKDGLKFLADVVTGKTYTEWNNHMLTNSQLQYLPEAAKTYLAGTSGFARSSFFLKEIALYAMNYKIEPFSDADNAIFNRFAQVFDQSYTRFLDLQTAEKNAYKNKVEAALERVRSRAMAMQEPEELKDVAQILRTEMGLLGFEELETCSIYILDKKVATAECWYAIKNSDKNRELVADHISMDFTATWVGKQMLEFHDSKAETRSIVMKGDIRKEWITYCMAKSKVLKDVYSDTIPDRTYHLHKFSHGAIGAASAGDISAESWALLKRSASVFSLAYARFKDLTQARIDLKQLKKAKQRAEEALSELQQTQKQLIQSEKMASLGELTAGIAHEIQNPLNFVNNFSEVSKELLEEMQEEIENGDFEEVKAIMNDVIQNLEKINHHGKRADGIVKGMLQHSRSSTGTKEPTDINTLADEYLRLAYHGLRAKDKSFNAELVTDFDTTIGKIPVIPQDIGRVILNLITNAFYAVNEKNRLVAKDLSGFGNLTGVSTFQPTVSVSTKKLKDTVEISVKDNGKGIPKNIVDKIFQPFFTTKPTGQGTGLGLSMSYDIVTKGHGGELKVETEENVGTEFIISLTL